MPLSLLAKGVAYIDNVAGGRIVITNEVCRDKKGEVYKDMYRAYTYTSSGDTYDGCFEFEDDTIHFYWPAAKKEQRIPIDQFTPLKK